MNNIENILKCLIDNLEEGICIVDKNGRTIYYNSSMERTEGLKADQVIGKKVVEYLKDMKEDSSTLMNALKKNEKFVDILQHYSGEYGKKITTINTTIPVLVQGEAIAAIEISKDMTQLKELNEKLCRLQATNQDKSNHYLFKDIIGNSKAISSSVNKAMKASLSNSSVLIYGETGCGKEVFAQSIHYNGVRKDKPFIPINCAAIPGALLEGLLFGTVKGSFTGAENKKGLFEAANRGTILLDEVNSMDTYLQSKLLRVLQEGYVRPIGSNKNIDVDVRIIATLNEEPEKLITEGRLRKDFFYRLSVIRIDIPSLRNRKEDIDILVKNFIDYYNVLLHKNVEEINDEVLNAFYNYDWPGNVRELKNIIESAMNMVDNKKCLTKEYFDNQLLNINNNSNEFSSILKNNISLSDYLEGIEISIIKDALKRNNNNISKTSKELKISRQNLQYKIKKSKLL